MFPSVMQFASSKEAERVEIFGSTKEDRIREFIVENVKLKKFKTTNNQRRSSSKRLKNDAFGTLCFQGFGQNAAYNAPYVKVSAVEAAGGNEEDQKMVENVWKLMSDYWCMQTPKLIISVTGGAKSLYMKRKLRDSFKRGLMKAASSSDAWIVTGGTKTGVMEIVGEAVRDYHLQNGSAKQIVVVGIATWGIVANRERLRDKNNMGYFPCYYNIHEIDTQEDGSALLDPNHTHFILVDNGVKGNEAFGGEIGFRTALENYISIQAANVLDQEMEAIPAVLLVLEGGKNTLQTAYQAIEQSTPVVVIEGSGRAADLIAFASKLNTMEDANEQAIWNQCDKLLSPPADKKKDHNDGCVDFIKKILHVDKKNLITIIKQEKDDSGENIDQAIINALIKASGRDTKNQLELALTWNRHDIARNEIFSVENMPQWRQYDLNEVMHRALIDDKDEFVTLFLDSGLDLRKFLTIKRLYSLYQDTLDDPTAPPIVCLVRNLTKEARYRYWTCGKAYNDEDDYPPNLLQIIGQVINKLTEDQRENVYSDKKYIVDVTKGENNAGFSPDTSNSDMNDTNRLVLEDQKKPPPTLNGTGPVSEMNGNVPQTIRHGRGDFKYTERELFIWALLFNRRNLAEIFWRLGKDHISGALTASMLLTSLSEAADAEEELDLAQNLRDNAQEFQNLAIGVLNECYQKDKPMSHELMIRELKQWGKKTLFLLADAGDQMDFMEHTCCQTKLNKNWKGKMALYTPMWLIILCLLFPFLSWPLIKFNDTSDSTPSNEVAPTGNDNLKDNNRSGPSKRKAKKINIFWAIYYYQTAPVVKFCYHTIFYVIFLGLFSFFMLTNLQPYDPSIPGDSPSIAEYVIYFWVFTLWVEELRQIFSEEPISISKKLQAYFSSSWNRFDQVINILFIISVILRWTLPVDQFVWARMFYTITLSLYYIRFLQFFYVEKNIGPKVVMIRQMVRDMMLFLMLLAVFFLSYGVAQQALLYPNEIKTWDILFGVVYEPYFNIYGEFNLDELQDLIFFIMLFAVFLLAYGVAQQSLLFPNELKKWDVLLGVVYQPYFSIYGAFDLQELQGDVPGCSSNATVYENDPSVPRCPEDSWLVMVLFSIYLILTNILLINLLIAMFSYTFTNVQDNSAKVWRFYRYGLIKEYFAKPTLAPPLIILSHAYRAIKYLIRRCRKTQKLIKNDFMQQFLKEKDRHLAEFERSGMYEYYLNQKRAEQEGQEYKMSLTGQRMEKVQLDVEFLRDSVPKQPESKTVVMKNLLETTTPSGVSLSQSMVPVPSYSRLAQESLEEEVGIISRRLNHMEDQLSVMMGMLKRMSESPGGSPTATRRAFSSTRPLTNLTGLHQIHIRDFDQDTSDT